MHCDHKNAILDEFLAAAERQEAAAYRRGCTTLRKLLNADLA